MGLDQGLLAHKIVDTDTHLSEVADLWTTRLPTKYRDAAPTVAPDRRGELRWRIGNRWLTTLTAYAHAGWDQPPPGHPTTLEQCDPAAFYAKDRLQRMDEFGVYAQVLYPNLVGFFGQTFLEELGEDAATACVRAYNDYLTEFCAVDPDRLIPVTAIPYWDVAESVREIERCAARGHRGILFGVNWPAIGLPPVGSGHWDPIFAAAEEMDLPVNAHIGFAQVSDADFNATLKADSAAAFGRDGLMLLIGNARNVADVVTSGILHRYPKMNLVAVESGCGWLPFLLEAMDWQWKNLGAVKEFPDRELPSFYIRRQIYGMFWFEEAGARTALEALPDNIMWETDFPHPTSLSPGPASFAGHPHDHILRSLEGVSPETVHKVLHGTAERLYRLDAS